MDVADAFAFHGVQSDAEADALEGAINTHAEASELVEHARLWGYYSSLDAPTDLQVERKLAHLVALIERRPWEPVLAVPLSTVDARNHVVAQAWRDQATAHLFRPDVLANAAAFLQHWDLQEARRLLDAAIEIEPTEWRWRLRLGRMLLNVARAFRDQAAQMRLATEAMAVLKEAAAMASARERGSFLDALTESAFMAENSAAASDYAEQALSISKGAGWEQGNLEHIAHTVLGALAFDASAAAVAHRHLEDSLAVPKSPQFDVRGPSCHLLRRFGSEPSTVDSFVQRWRARFGLPAGWNLDQTEHGQRV